MRAEVRAFLSDYIESCGLGDFHQGVALVLMERHGFMDFSGYEKLWALEEHRKTCPHHDSERGEPFL